MCNYRISGNRVRAWQETIAHVPQSIYLADTTLAENIAFGVPPEAIDLNAHRTSNPRVFGSVLDGDDAESSDLDLLVEPSANTSLLDIARIQVELEARLGVSVDVFTPAALPVKFRSQVLLEARPV